MDDRYTIFAECQNCGHQFTKDFPCGEEAGFFECSRCKCQCAHRKETAPIQYVPSPYPVPVSVPYIAPMYVPPVYIAPPPFFQPYRIWCSGGTFSGRAMGGTINLPSGGSMARITN